jgi:hypothetical protein
MGVFDRRQKLGQKLAHPTSALKGVNYIVGFKSFANALSSTSCR